MQLHSKRISLPQNYTAVSTRKVLLLEGDPAFKAFLTKYLESAFFDVTVAKSGVEGLRQILKTDFDVIICDMMMPTLAGDMFYFAVDRIKPIVCERFIFMTGLKANPKIGAFIRNAKGTMLSKPFHVDDLLESIAFIEQKTRAARDSESPPV